MEETAKRDHVPDQLTLAVDRTVLAVERTFAAWLRTGLAFLSVGLALQRVLHGALPDWELRLLGSVLIVCAGASFAAAGWRDRRIRMRLPEPSVNLLPLPLTVGVTVVLVTLAFLSDVAVWTM